MSTYLEPWRKKMGVLVLVVACLFAAGWVRSQSIEDSFYRVSGVGLPAYVEFQSTNGYILWWSGSKSYFAANSSYLIWGFPAAQVINPNNYNSRSSLMLTVFGIGIGSSSSNGKDRDVLIVPYWSIVTPLTLLSTWLLLFKRRLSETIETRAGLVT